MELTITKLAEINYQTVSQEKTGGNVYAQYAFGNFKVGYTKGELEPSKTTDKYGTASADTATALNGDAV